MKRALIALIAAVVLALSSAGTAVADPVVQLKLAGNCKQHINVELVVELVQVCFEN